MMTKMTTPNPVVNRQSSYKTGRQAGASSSVTETGVDFGKIVDRRLEEKTQISKTYTNSTAQSGSGHEVQAKYAYDDVDPARMEQLRQNAQNANKEKLSDKPELQDFDDEEMEQIAALAASLQTLSANSKVDEENNSDKLSTISAIFNDVLDGIKEGALNANGTALKNSVDKMKDLLETLKNGGMPEDITEENGSKLMELMTLLLKELGTETEEGKLESAKDPRNQLLEEINGLLGNQNDDKAKSVDNNNIVALMQQIVAKTNQLMNGEQAAITKEMAKKEFSAKLHETMDVILTAASQKDMDDAALKTMIEKLVSDLFAGNPNDKNNSTINGILQKYGLLDSEGGKSINKLGLDELKTRIANALMMLAEKVGNESDEKSKKSLDLMDKFSKVLDDNLTGKGIEKQQSNGLAGDSKKGPGLNEDKLLNKLLGKDTSDTDSKTNKINSLISQINNSKNDIEAEKVVEKPVITKGNFSQDIIKTVRYMNLNNLKELTVKIAPKELGEITIKLTMTDGVMKANISANSKEAFNLLTTNVGEIKSSLENNTIKIQDVDINIYQEDASFNRDNANRDKNNQSNKNHNTNSQGQIDIAEAIENTTEADADNNISILI